MTFSIVARDADTGDLGCAVASKFPAVGAVVPAVLAGVGAIASQSFVNARYRPDGMALLQSGVSPDEVVYRLTDPDDERAVRQLGIVDAGGSASSFTGTDCLEWAGGLVGAGYAIQGNILASADVIAAMESAWLDGVGLALGGRLICALEAGDRAGGDRRGRQSAALIVQRVGAGYGGATGQLIDLRVDDHVDPVPELRRLLEIHDLLFGSTPEADWVPVDASTAARIRAALRTRVPSLPADGAFDGELEDALRAWVIDENLDERWWGGDRIDPVVLAHLLR
ncbi:MAG: DUF1028 domain-containing protein [Actinomycetota bacterium]